MVNAKFILSVFLFFLVSSTFAYFILFSDSSNTDNPVERILKSVGFEDADGIENSPAVPLPSGVSGLVTGGSGGGGGGSGVSQESGSPIVLHFCTFDAFHSITSSVPCRCGISAVCEEEGQYCDATSGNGEGTCE